MTTQTISDDMKKLQEKWRKDYNEKNPCCKSDKGKVAGHVPDTKMGNDAYPPLSEGMTQMKQTNSYLGGIAGRIPAGKTYSNVKLVGSLGGC